MRDCNNFTVVFIGDISRLGFSPFRLPWRARLVGLFRDTPFGPAQTVAVGNVCLERDDLEEKLAAAQRRVAELERELRSLTPTTEPREIAGVAIGE